MNIRYPIVAGHFYPLNSSQLKANMDKYIKSDYKKFNEVYGIIAPHAGYIYSGKTAGMVYGSIDIPDTAIILCPNHTGLGKPISLHPAEQWITPLGSVEVDSSFLNRLAELLPEAQFNEDSQLREHALEVQIPFLQYLNPKIKIIPITVSNLPFEVIKKVGKSIATIISEREKNNLSRPLIIASSDMTHFESVEKAEKKDKQAISFIKKMNAEGLINTVMENNITMCGVLPVAIMIEALKELSVAVSLIDYSTSADVSGDIKDVVAYAGLVLYKKIREKNNE